jgi:NAD(P)-dependent dehydrogenase (short-subunit alcohol dehydrogenase family)
MQQASLVTGASQGVGKGIVEGLSEAGQTVFFTGRDSARLTQVEREANALGGTCFARQVDHNDDTAVNALVAEITENNAIGILVNNAWGGYERMVENGKFTFIDSFWEQPLWRWDAMMTTGVRAGFVVSQLAVRNMLDHGGGLIINISFWAAQKFTGNTLYGIAKAATDKMTADMAVELKNTNIHVISLYPGLVRTEKVMANAAYLDLSNSESPRFIGRVISALQTNMKLREELNGAVAVAADIARRLGVVDSDGSSPEPLTLEDL